MKFIKAALLLLLLSVIFSGIVYYITSGTITSSSTDMVGEIGVVAVPIFIFLMLIYIASKIGARMAKKARKKSPPNQEGPKQL